MIMVGRNVYHNGDLSHHNGSRFKLLAFHYLRAHLDQQ